MIVSHDLEFHYRLEYKNVSADLTLARTGYLAVERVVHTLRGARLEMFSKTTETNSTVEMNVKNYHSMRFFLRFLGYKVKKRQFHST